MPIGYTSARMHAPAGIAPVRIAGLAQPFGAERILKAVQVPGVWKPTTS